MAKKRTKTAHDGVKPSFAQHFRALGLANVHRYYAWCADRGFAASADKTPQQLAAELNYHAREQAKLKARENLQNDVGAFLDLCCRNRISADDLTRPGWANVQRAIAATRKTPQYRESLRDFLVTVAEKSDFLFADYQSGPFQLDYIDGLLNLHHKRSYWRRDPADWRPKSRNRHKQFSELARYLVADYDVPLFLDEAWLRVDAIAQTYRNWFVHIGLGKNLRSAIAPYPLSKKHVHWFLQTPDDYTIEHGLVWADVRALGGDPRLAEAVIHSRLGVALETREDRRAFWLSVTRFFIDNPLLDRSHVGPIIDYLHFQKYQAGEIMVAPGLAQPVPPPQPGLTMRGRTPETLLRQMNAWHTELSRVRAAERGFFRASGFAGLELETGAEDSYGRRAVWRIRELLSAAELVDEGRRMRHCVASYAGSCAAGHCSIWTMDRLHPDGRVEKHLTLEVLKTGALVQARGLANRLPTEQERHVLGAWVRSAGLRSVYYG